MFNVRPILTLRQIPEILSVAPIGKERTRVSYRISNFADTALYVIQEYLKERNGSRIF
jgi:hypothetical protein